MKRPDKDTGGCACKRVRYELTASPLFVHCCHCTWCQRETGSAFVLNLLIETLNVEVTRGQAVLVTIPSASGNGQTIARCEHCQVALWSHFGSRRNISFVRAGTLDDAASHPPDVHIFTSSKHPWIELPEDIPCFEEFYSYREQWPADSFARLKQSSDH